MAENKPNSSNEDLELERIRLQKLSQIMKAKQAAEMRANQKIPTTAEKVDLLLKVLMQPDAMAYFNEIKKRSVSVYNAVRAQLFPPDVMAELDTLMNYYRQGMIQQGIISMTEIQLIERQVMGVSSSITVKKQGEKAVGLGSFLKDK